MNEQLKEHILDTEHGVIYPIYEYIDYDNNTDTYTGLIIIKTAQEVYDKWLENKDRPIEPPEDLGNKIIVLQQQVEVLSQEKLELQVELEETKTKLSETEARVNATEDAVLELMMK